MAHSRLYRNFLILQEEEKGYSTSYDKPLSGYAKLEGKGDRCRISFYAQNLKKDNYHMMLICNKKGIKQNILLDTMNINEQGKAEVIKEYNASDIANSKIGIDKVVAAALVKLLDNSFSVVMLGVMSGEKLPEGWQAFEISPIAEEPKSAEELEVQQAECIAEVPVEILTEQQRSEAQEVSFQEVQEEAPIIEDTKEPILEEKNEELTREKEVLSTPEYEASSEKQAQQETEAVEAPRDMPEKVEDIDVTETPSIEAREEELDTEASDPVLEVEEELPLSKDREASQEDNLSKEQESQIPESEAIQEIDMSRQSEEASEEMQQDPERQLIEEPQVEPSQEEELPREEPQVELPQEELPREEPQVELPREEPQIELPQEEEDLREELQVEPSQEVELPREELNEDSEENEDEFQAEGEDFLGRSHIVEHNFDEYEKLIEDSKAAESKRDDEEEFVLRGSIAHFFEAAAEGFEEVRGISEELKYSKWYKVKVDNLDTLLNITDYNKYTIAYYPMMNYYPYFRSYGHFLLGYKCDPKGSLKYIMYGVPGRKNAGDQPYGGKSGFVTWIPPRDGGDIGYWIMFYDFKNSIIVVPMK